MAEKHNILKNCEIVKNEHTDANSLKKKNDDLDYNSSQISGKYIC